MTTPSDRESPFGSKKVTQAEVAMFVKQATTPLFQRIVLLQNAVDVLYSFLSDVGDNGAKNTQEEIVAYAQSRNAKSNG